MSQFLLAYDYIHAESHKPAKGKKKKNFEHCRHLVCSEIRYKNSSCNDRAIFSQHPYLIFTTTYMSSTIHYTTDLDHPHKCSQRTASPCALVDRAAPLL